MIVARSSAFVRAYKNLIAGRPDLEKVFRNKIALFMTDPYDARLATHKLKGTLKDSWAFSLNYSLRVVFRFEKNDVVVLENIGPHDDVY